MAFTLPPLPDQLKRKALRGEVIQQTEMFDRLDMPLLQITANKGRIRWANQAARHLLGESVLDKRLIKIFQSKTLQNALQALKEKQQDDLVVSAKNLPGREFKVRLVWLDKKTLQDARVLVAMTDVTEVLSLQSQRANFVANASHELKSPITALAGFIETLNADPAALPAFLPLLTKETERLRRLITDLLSLARLEIEGEQIAHKTLDLAALLDMAAEASALAMAEQQHDLRLKPTDIRLKGDEAELSTAFTNLLINAAKYAPPNSEISVTVEMTKTRILIHFDNPGPGIAPEHIPHLTERFYRVDDGRSRTDGGTGLGLAIVKHVLIRHKGELIISSKPDKGARFTVSLPVIKKPKIRSVKALYQCQHYGSHG